VYAAGSFNNIGGAARSCVAALDSSTGLALAWNPAPTVTVNAVLPLLDRVYLGGNFTQVGLVSRSRFASVDTVTGAVGPWNPGLDLGSVNALATGPGVIYAGGDFNSVGGVPRTNLAAVGDPALTVSVASGPAPALRVQLGPPVPQPLRGSGRITFELARSSRVDLALYDPAGRRVRALITGETRAAGRHVIGIETAGMAPGVYFAYLRTALGEASQRVVVLGQ
jgi:hypothetical protein